MSESQYDIALIDNRPFFETALRHGVQRAIIPSSKIASIEAEAPKGMVQIAETFGSKYLRPDIEAARKRIVNLSSLYLIETSRGDLDVAAKLIRDNTFLTLSRGGSGLLKALFALPEYALLGREAKGRVEDFLEVWSLKEKPHEYRNTLTHRQLNALEIEAGYWFGDYLGISGESLKEEDAEAVAVIRSALFVMMFGSPEDNLANQLEFATLLEAVRTMPAAKRNKAIEKVDLSEIPEKFMPIVTRIIEEIKEHDLPVLQDKKLSLDRLVFSLKDKYYLGDHEIEDTSEYDALVSKEWSRLTKGKTDVDSLMTLFVCISAGIPPKTAISEKVAKSIVKQFRKDGFPHDLAVAWIKQSAPHEKQEGLLEDWANFVDEADTYIMDDWDTTYSGAMRFLALHCHVQKSTSK